MYYGFINLYLINYNMERSFQKYQMTKGKILFRGGETTRRTRGYETSHEGIFVLLVNFKIYMGCRLKMWDTGSMSPPRVETH